MNGLVGVLAHHSHYADPRNEVSDRNYAGIVFAMDPISFTPTSYKSVAGRAHFPDAPAKLLPPPRSRDNVKNVIFPGGLIRNADATADLYAGLSDAARGRIRIADPFLEYEQLAAWAPPSNGTRSSHTPATAPNEM